MTKRGRIVGNARRPGWERDNLGYLANPDEIYEIRTLKNIVSKLPNCERLSLEYCIHENGKKKALHGVSLHGTVEPILAICAATGLPFRGIKLCDHHIGTYDIILGPRDPMPQKWDMSKPLLEAACTLIPALEIALEPQTRELEWVESFFVKCSNLKQLCARFESRIRHVSGSTPSLFQRHFCP